MLKRLSQRELLEQVAADWSPQIRAAWVEAINAITSRIVLRRIVEKLERGDIAGAIADLGITDGTFAKFENALIQAYHGGGIATVSSMPIVRDPYRANLGSWTNSPTSYAYAWEEDDSGWTAIPNSNVQELEYAGSNALRVTVTATNGAGPGTPAVSLPVETA